MERKGITTERGDMNPEISRMNQILFAIIAKLKQLKDWLKEAVKPAAPPTLASILQSFLEGGEPQSHYGNIRNPKSAERVLAFMQDNGISKMSEIRNMYSETYDQYENNRQNVTYYERRAITLDENIKQGGIYLKYKDLSAEYQSLKPRKQPKFYEAYRMEFTLFEAARRYSRISISALIFH